MERHFDEQLGDLRLRLIRMGSLAELMITDALRVLVQRDSTAAAAVESRENEVNAMQIEIDELCLQLIAMHQPVAGDLRFLLGAIKTNTDVERLADLAVNVCDKGVKLLASPPLMPFATIPEMGTTARGMVKDSLDAYVNRDVTLARQVLLRDDELDTRKRSVTANLANHMREHPETIGPCLELVLVVRNLERIGDHATNIAENIVFVVQGKDIRHHAEDQRHA